MKKIFIIALALLFLASGVFAANSQKGIHEPGTGIENPEVKQNQQEINQGSNSSGQGNTNMTQVETNTQNQGQDTMIKVQTNTQTQQGTSAGNGNQNQVKKQEQLQTQTQQNIENGNGNQNQVRAAVQNLLMLKDGVSSGIGQQISDIAQNFNNSIEKTDQAENKIRNRNAFLKFLIGGDAEAAEEIQEEITTNAQALLDLNGLVTNCESCNSETKNLLLEQIQTMEQEQERLQELANQQMNARGVFGWLFQLFK